MSSARKCSKKPLVLKFSKLFRKIKKRILFLPEKIIFRKTKLNANFKTTEKELLIFLINFY